MTMHSTIIASATGRFTVSTYDDRRPILSFTDTPVGFQISHKDTLTAAQAEAFADSLVTAAIEFAEATRREAARVAQSVAESTYSDNIITVSVAPTEDEVQR